LACGRAHVELAGGGRLDLVGDGVAHVRKGYAVVRAVRVEELLMPRVLSKQRAREPGA